MLTDKTSGDNCFTSGILILMFYASIIQFPFEWFLPITYTNFALYLNLEFRLDKFSQISVSFRTNWIFLSWSVS